MSTTRFYPKFDSEVHSGVVRCRLQYFDLISVHHSCVEGLLLGQLELSYFIGYIVLVVVDFFFASFILIIFAIIVVHHL